MQRHRSSLNTRKSLQQGIVKQNEGPRRRQTSRPTGWNSVSIDRMQIESRHYGSLWDNQLDGIHHCTPTSLATRKHLIAWTERKLLRHYEVPQKIVNIIRNSYDGLNCKIVHGSDISR
ncbi:unnamed protein product [Schistosoma curassoni]|uniref:Uncharacterized protein n=1 Tax=Schistosoma curassoni TaxID=6186 RepID=A0A3P7Y7C9_9TREM|nr:unnamed protein product [Schistosoma curassoni]